MQVPGGNLDPQPQRGLELTVWPVLIEPVRADDILGVHEVLAKVRAGGPRTGPEACKRSTLLRAQPCDEFAYGLVSRSRSRSRSRRGDR